MSQLPRVAVGTIQPGAEVQFALWGLLDLVDRLGQRVQVYHSRACFPRCDGAASVTGQCARHLDSWLMSPDLCRQLFVRASRTAHLSVIEGSFALGDNSGQGGSLEQLCEWLDLPRLVVVDAANLEGCRLPERPREADALLLDCVADASHARRLQTTFQSLWGLPVLGALQTMPGLRSAFAGLCPGSRPPRDMCAALGQNLQRNLSLPGLERIARSRSFSSDSTSLFGVELPLERVRVAIAYDEAFHCYFPDTLELLEALGAEVEAFSPLKDEALPPDSDLVYLGCGHPERHARELAANYCMAAALRSHAATGRRIYAEGGGLAYLCERLQAPSGELVPMSGVLPAIAFACPSPAPARPVEITLSQTNWLGEGWSRLRGYLNSAWNLQPTGPLATYASQQGHELDLVGMRHAIGSRIHLNFAATPEYLRRLVQPDRRALRPACR